MATIDRGGFGALLRRRREEGGISQAELAERAGLSVEAVSALERGTRRSPHAATMRLLGDALGLRGPPRVAFEAAARGQEEPAALREQTGALSATDPAAIPLVGRTRELALLDRHLAGTGPPVLLLAGEPGIGKTRLLREVAARSVGKGWHVLAGGCQRRGGQEPYAPLLGALQLHILPQSPARLRASLRGCAWLVRLLPELAVGPIEPLPPWMLPPEQERRLLFEAVRRYLANVAGPAGTLLLLDDLQWASGDALELLAALAVTAHETQLRIVGAYRDTEVGPRDPLAVTLADLAHGGLAAQDTLGPLASEEAAQVLDRLFAEGGGELVRKWGGLRERVMQRAGGVPFFLCSCVQALRVDAAPDVVPWDVAQGIRQRVAAVPITAQEVLGAAAVAGRVVQRQPLLAMGARAEGEILDALAILCRARLLEEDGTDAYRFPHDVIREVVEADLGTAQRMVLHRRLVAALERGGDMVPGGEAPPALLAYHHGHGGDHDKAVLYLDRAGDRAAAQHAHVAAEGFYRELVERLDSSGCSADAAHAREKWGAALRLVGRYDAALAALTWAAETYRALDDPEGLGRVTAEIGHVHAGRGTPDEGMAAVRPVLAALELRGPSRTLAALHVALAKLCVKNGHYRLQLEAAERAGDVARAVGDGLLLAQAERFRGYALTFLGRIEEGLRVDRQAVEQAERSGDLESLCGALHSMSHIHCLRGEFARSRRYKDRALAVAQQLGDPAELAFQTLHLGLVNYWSGDWRQAWEDYERGIALTRRIGLSYLPAYALLVRGLLCYGEGDWEEAARDLEMCSATAARAGDLQPRRLAQHALAELDLREGRPEAAHHRLVPLLDRPGLEERDVTLFLPTLAWTYLEVGDLKQAGAVLEGALRRARAGRFRPAWVEALRVRALLVARQGCWPEAAQILEEALLLARAMPSPCAETRVLSTCGLLHCRHGAPERARDHLEAALAIAHRMGALKENVAIGQALAALRPS